MSLFETGIDGVKGVVIDKGFKCTICQNENQQLFHTYYSHHFKQEITYCRNCIMMTWSTTETYYQLTEIPSLPENLECHLDFELTEQQQYASEMIDEAVKTGGKRLLHAVTGAGKTEMILKGIQSARSIGMNVALVSPRVDVVKELYLRMTSYFTADIDVLYEGHPLTYNSTFVICTVQQLYRYFHHFSLIVVDEVDAFPLPMDDRLMSCIHRAATPVSTIIYLTATPPKRLIQQFNPHDIITLPARYHGRPLPVPSFKYLSIKTVLKGGLSARLQQRTKGTLLLFFNNIREMETAGEVYKNFNPVTVYADDALRHEKVDQIRAGHHLIVFTTSILERGFTKAGLDVWVIDAGSFTSECLIQMAGRVDRKRDPYKGEVVFFHNGVSSSMQKAVKEIQRMNHAAVSLGWIK
ncbi:DEAD/DEAH box helicase family protein [Macrococcus lamae]|nr:DEAD/DEAH box helicase family protein [Macrococcus lamae]